MILKTVRMGPDKPAGPPVVMLHGLFGSASNWGRVQRRLAETHLVLAMDQRNHGGSPHDAAVDYPTMATAPMPSASRVLNTSAAMVG